MELVRLKKEDCDETIKVLNNVFSIQNNNETCVEKSNPRIYSHNDTTMGYHVAIKDKGNICGVAANFPISYHMCGEELKLGYIGAVAVDMNYRNQGFMQKMVGKLIEDGNSEGTDMYFLLGDRWRYRHFGFERFGIECRMTIRKSMFREVICDREFSFSEIKETDDKILHKLYQLHSTRNVYVKREYDAFYASMTAEKKIGFAIYENDKLFGYMVVDSLKNSVIEIALSESSQIMCVLKQYIEAYDIERINICLAMFDELLKYVLPYSEAYTLTQPYKFKIVNFKKIVTVFMKAKCQYANMPDGVITINSEIFGKWSISKKSGDIRVEPFSGKADFNLEGDSVYQFIFGMIPPEFSEADFEKTMLAKIWFPLPICATKII